MRQIFDWHVREGLSVRGIAIRLTESGVPTPKRRDRPWASSTLDRLLRQEAYAGTLYYNRRSELSPGRRPMREERPKEEWVGLAVPPIVDLAIWARSQSLHKLNARFSPRHVGSDCYLLRRLVRCGQCGQARASAGRTRPSGAIRYYRCDNFLPMHLTPDDQRCSEPSARADELDELVWSEVVRHLRQPELVLKACTASAAGPGAGPAARRQLSGLRGQQRRLIDAYQAGAIDLAELQARQRPLADRATELGQLAALERDQHAARSELEQRISDFSQKVSAGLEAMTFGQRQELVRLDARKSGRNRHEP